MASDANEDTTHGGRGWLRRPRTLIVTAVAAALVVAGGVFLLSTEDDPVPVVQEYLDAIHAGRINAALVIAGDPRGGFHPFLSADALADDWRVDEIVERHRAGDMAEVEVTISAGGNSEQGRFSLRNFDGDWTIQNPYVTVSLDIGPMDMVELGGEEVPSEQLDSTPAATTVTVLLFPGAYRLYPSLADRVTLESTHLLALPHEEPQSPMVVTGELTEQGTDIAQQTFKDHLDNCVKHTVVSPKDCPFSARPDRRAVRTEALIDEDTFTEVRDLSWRITAYPEVTFDPGNGGFAVLPGKPGALRLTGSGIPPNGNESDRAGFTADCGFRIEYVWLAPAKDGFSVVPGNVIGVELSDARCRRPVG